MPATQSMSVACAKKSSGHSCDAVALRACAHRAVAAPGREVIRAKCHARDAAVAAGQANRHSGVIGTYGGGPRSDGQPHLHVRDAVLHPLVAAPDETERRIPADEPRLCLQLDRACDASERGAQQQ